MNVNGPPKTESKEDRRPPRYRTIERVVLREKEDMTHDESGEAFSVVEKFEQSVSCNGSYHRQIFEDVSYNKDGEVVYAKEVRREGLGPCDCARS